MNPAFNIKLLSILSICNAASAEYNPFWDNLIRFPIFTTFLNIKMILKIILTIEVQGDLYGPRRPYSPHPHPFFWNPPLGKLSYKKW